MIKYIKMELIYLTIAVFLTIFLIITYVLTMHPTYFLKPYNQYLYYRLPKKVFYNEEEKIDIFPLSLQLEERWIDIRNEGRNVLFTNGILENYNVYTHYLTIDSTFWTTFPLRMYNKDIKENMELCPILSSIIKDSSDVITCMYSMLAPGKELPPHYGPFKGVLRYHLGLDIPIQNNNEQCYISVDNEHYYWKEGEGIIFDENYEHYAKNTTSEPRMILFLDVKRPLSSYLLNLINNILIKLISISPHNIDAVADAAKRTKEKLKLTSSNVDIDKVENNKVENNIIETKPFMLDENIFTPIERTNIQMKHKDRFR